MAAHSSTAPGGRNLHAVWASILWLTVLAALPLLSTGGAVPANAAAQRASGWAWPLDPLPAVLRPFEAPESRYGPGHRGVDLAAAPAQVVAAVADGVVTHSGVVAGRGTVTVLHSSGVSSTYEPVGEGIASGSVVRRGDALGVLANGGPDGGPSHCAPAVCLHLGARYKGDYLDPLLLLEPVEIVLLPLRD